MSDSKTGAGPQHTPRTKWVRGDKSGSQYDPVPKWVKGKPSGSQFDQSQNTKNKRRDK